MTTITCYVITSLSNGDCYGNEQRLYDVILLIVHVPGVQDVLHINY